MGAAGSAYDEIVDAYDALVAGIHSPASVAGIATRAVLEVAGDVTGTRVCDLGCGEGHLARTLAERGAQVVGIDTSERLLELARARGGTVEFMLEDAQRLAALPDGSFDLAVCNLALMDIPDLRATYAAVRRVLIPGGRFVFAITHPCFQTPRTRIVVEEGRAAGRVVARYAREGFWRSEDPTTIRGRVGAHHRTLATYLNGLIAAGFVLRGLAEPTAPAGDPADFSAQIQVEVPSVLVVDAVIA